MANEHSLPKERKERSKERAERGEEGGGRSLRGTQTDKEGRDVRQHKDLGRPAGGDPEVNVHTEVPNKSAEQDVVGREHGAGRKDGEKIKDDVDARRVLRGGGAEGKGWGCTEGVRLGSSLTSLASDRHVKKG